MEPHEQVMHEEIDRLYRALGEFFLMWADVEVELYRALIHYAGVSDEIGRALFSGSRARIMIDSLKNICHNTKLDAKRVADLDYLFQQINTINTVRDRIAHYGSTSISFSHRTLETSLSNRVRVNRKGNEFHSTMSANLVENMTADLRRIHYRLSIHYRKSAPTEVGVDVPRDGPTWRYKPAQPSNQRSKSRRSPGTQ